MKNLLIITQKVDAEDDLLGFFVYWLREFSKKFDKVFVITLAKGNYNLPSNVLVYSLGKEKNNSKMARFINFYKFLFRIIPKTDGVFAHMSPVFVIASWPVAFIFGKRIVLWYLHRSATLRLKIATRLSYKIVTAAKESLKFNSKKIVETGHGINIEEFKTSRDWSSKQLRIISVGRISKIKNLETLLKAVKILKDNEIDFSLKIIGQPIMPPDFHYLEFLESLRNDLGLGEMIQFVGFVPHNKIPDYYKNSDIVVGLTPDGGIDKTILEGMASGCIAITSNNTCSKYFNGYSGELIFNYRNPESLAEKIMSLDRLPLENKKNISNFLVESVSVYHRLENVINRISSLL
jgi:glycosyltransferase involved in cell wall biosynthesis